MCILISEIFRRLCPRNPRTYWGGASYCGGNPALRDASPYSINQSINQSINIHTYKAT